MNGFAEAILDPARPAPDGLIGPGGAVATKRFDVYRNNVTMSLREALKTGFPATFKLLGEQNFNGLATAYLRSEPPVSPMMMHYGAGFPAFLESIEALAKYPYLSDVARLELALRASYHAADALALDPARLGALSAEALNAAGLCFAPSMKLVRSDWPIVSIWAFNMSNGAKPAMHPEAALILRAEFDPEPRALAPADAAAAASLIAGASLGQAHDAGTALDAAYDIGPLLGLFLSNSAITDLEDRA
ncbi:MAG: DNA-binding domain-containing protein [Pseudomonadota bacterium]